MKFKRIISLTMVVVLAISTMILGACGDTEKDKGSASSGNNGGGDGLSAYDETVQVNILKTVQASASYIEGESLDDNVLTRFIKEKLNIEIVNKWSVANDQYNTQFEMLVNSDELPDMAETNLTTVTKMYEYGQLQPLTEVYEEYATDYLRSWLEYNDKQAFDAVTFDGELYALPLPNDIGDYITIAYVREDWRKELGLPEPKTLDDYYELAKAFVENDMAGQGKNNTLGIGMAADLGYAMDALGTPFGAYQERWIDYGDGTLEFSSLQPEMKEALQFVNKCYKEGLIDSNFASSDFNRIIQLALQGRVGIVYGPFWYSVLYLRSSITADSGIEWKAYPIAVNNDTEELNVPAGNATYRYLVCRDGYENPEALVKLMNLWAEIWQGQYAEWFFGLSAAGEDYEGIELKYYYPIFFDPPYKNCDVGISLREAFADPDNPDPTGLTPNAKAAYDVLVDPEQDHTYNELLWFNVFKVISDYNDGATYIYNEYQGPTTENMTSYSGLCNSYLKGEFIKLITGERSFDDWDDIVDQWYKIGGTSIEKDVNEWYKNR